MKPMLLIPPVLMFCLASCGEPDVRATVPGDEVEADTAIASADQIRDDAQALQMSDPVKLD